MRVDGPSTEEIADDTADKEANGTEDDAASPPAREPLGARARARALTLARARRAGRALLFARTPVALSAALAVALIAVAAWTIVMSRQAAAAQRVQAARGAAVSAAARLVPQILSYDYHTLAQNLATGEGATTGGFTARYHDLFTKRIEPAARKSAVVTNADVVGTSVVTASERKVVTLVYIDQTTTDGNSSSPKLDSSRALVTLVPVGPRWLVSAVTPI